jgi:hypothetical protein
MKLDPKGEWLNAYTTRFLNEDDLEIYLELLSKTSTFMGNVYDADQDRETAKTLLLDPRNKIAGTFDSSNKLVTVVSGYFYPDFPHWYTYRVFQQATTKSLVDGIRNYMLLLKNLNLLLDYAESNHYYSFYNIFTLDHQIPWEKGLKMMAERGMYDPKYEFYWEDIYLPGEECKHRHHQFFFKKDNQVSVPCVITLCTLKQSTRRQYFNERYKITDTVNYLPGSL